MPSTPSSSASKRRTHIRQRDGRIAVKIKLTSIYVNDQEMALRFYTEVAGFVKKADFVDDVQRE